MSANVFTGFTAPAATLSGSYLPYTPYVALRLSKNPGQLLGAASNIVTFNCDK